MRRTAVPAGSSAAYGSFRMERVTRRRALPATLALVAAFVLALASPVGAATIEDPDNARGPLDLKRLVATKHDATAPLHLKLVTWETWRASLLDVSGENRILFLFNNNDSGPANFVGEVFFRDGRLLMRITTAGGRFVRRVRVAHPTRRSITAVVPRGLPNPDGNAYLAAREQYRSTTGFCVSGCHDRIPNEGWLKVTPGL